MSIWYKCPVCRKLSQEHLDLARHYLGQTDQKHKDWLKSKGLSYAKLITMQVAEFGNQGYDSLAKVLEKEAAKVEVDVK
jgi:hypothetical protein